MLSTQVIHLSISWYVLFSFDSKLTSVVAIA